MKMTNKPLGVDKVIDLSHAAVLSNCFRTVGYEPFRMGQHGKPSESDFSEMGLLL